MTENNDNIMTKIKTVLASACTLALAGTMLTACTADFEETNQNPNKVTVNSDVSPSNLFEPILYPAAQRWQYNTWFWNDELIQFTAFTGGTTRQEHRYFISDQDWSGLWNSYASYANNADNMAKVAEAKADPSLQAIGLTLKVLFMSNLTDMFGDIPYAEAFLGRQDGSYRQPKFDSQKDVYLQMFNDLEKANAIYATKPAFQNPTLDKMYGGDAAKWQKFNNSLYLRLLCRVGGRSEMEVPRRMKALLSNPDAYPIFTSNADNARVNYTGTAPYVGEFAAGRGTTEADFTTAGRKIAQQFVKMTVETDATGSETYEDPRLKIWARKHDGYTYWKGTVAGCTTTEQSTVDKGTSYLNNSVLNRATMPSEFMDYAEVEFILAEAALKGWIDGGDEVARQHYEQAVKASVEKWDAIAQTAAKEQGFVYTPVTPEGTDSLLNSQLASWTLNDNHGELIADQKYLGLFWIGMEAYHEYRRTGYPTLTIGAGTQNDHILPTRFAYPATTVAVNSAHVKEALDRMGGANDMKTPVWWSKQAIGK